MLFVNCLVPLHQFFQIVDTQIGVEFDLLLGLELGDFMLEIFVLHSHRGRTEHVDQPPVAIVGKSCISGLLGQPFDTCIGKTEVEDGVHHPGHGESRPGSNGYQEWIGRIAKFLPTESGFNLFHTLIDLWDR